MSWATRESLRERDKELAQKKDTLAQSQKRIAELDVIIKRLYEDNISGKLSDERFIKLSRDYELEQTNLTNLVEHLRQEVKEQEKQKAAGIPPASQARPPPFDKGGAGGIYAAPTE